MESLLLAVAASVSATAPPTLVDPRVTAITARTRESRATYALYNWTRITRPGRDPIEEWAAEFNRGAMHRVETPRDRIVADCAAMTATYYNVLTGEESTGSDIAKTACGIDSTLPNVRSTWLGRSETQFGPADRILIERSDGIRTYAVADNGAIIAESITNPAGVRILTNAAVAVLPTLPADDIFSTDSLQSSVVPDEFKAKPITPELESPGSPRVALGLPVGVR